MEGWEEQRGWLVLWKMARMICPGSLGFVGVREMWRGLAGLMLSRRNPHLWLGWRLGRRDWLNVRRWACLFQDVFLWFPYLKALCGAAQRVPNLEVRISKRLE